MNLLIVAKLPLIRKIPFDVVVHIPRSGTIPASLIATYLRVPLASVDEFCAGITNTRGSKTDSLHRILVVDDSIRTGVQMKQNVDRIKAARPDAEIKTMSVFSTVFPGRVFDADLVLSEHTDTEYIYPWFLWKSNRIKDCVLDMDGVLCRDCTREEDDDGERYRQFLETADLKFRTDHRFVAVVTGRLEKYRPQTEDWLRRHGLRPDKVIMGPWSSIEERRIAGPAAWKGSVYRKMSQALLFVESSVREAPVIAQVSGKTVFCIDDQVTYG